MDVPGDVVTFDSVVAKQRVHVGCDFVCDVCGRKRSVLAWVLLDVWRANVRMAKPRAPARTAANIKVMSGTRFEVQRDIQRRLGCLIGCERVNVE